ncbi:YqzL family protein [Bacillus horti]|uniref:YqzL family protein n=1 Tax=Caldalkalibacillus horti TaxID=77523 RepID=A0ABT9W489_9BACI|nr:hypothetical protein [Bacillus horti]
MMREISWNVFAVTGNIEAYLLYRECEDPECEELDEVQQEELSIQQ